MSSNHAIDIATTNMAANGSITTVAGTDNAGAGRARIDSTADASAIAAVITDIDAAINQVNSERATMGASQSRFESVIATLQIGLENQSAARSRVMDADFAAETANLSRSQILQQAGVAMAAQARLLGQNVLTLLGQC